jgi:hypothetical protein
MAKKYQPSPVPWRTQGSHKPNGEAVYIVQDAEQTAIGTIRSEGLEAETILANRKLIENAPRMARVLIEVVAICINNNIPVKANLCDLIQDITGVNPRTFDGIEVDDA